MRAELCNSKRANEHEEEEEKTDSTDCGREWEVKSSSYSASPVNGVGFELSSTSFAIMIAYTQVYMGTYLFLFVRMIVCLQLILLEVSSSH